MSAHSKLDKEVFDEFVNDRDRLHAITTRIRSVLTNEPLRKTLLKVDDDDDPLSGLLLEEGEVLYRLHKYRERNPKLVAAKKKAVLKATGALACEVCTFDFARTYGSLGKGFIECHHTKPLSEYESAALTKLDDLAVVCANCHRMLHKQPGMLTVGELRGTLDRVIGKLNVL